MLQLEVKTEAEIWVLRFALERYRDSRKTEEDRGAFQDSEDADELLRRLNAAARNIPRL